MVSGPITCTFLINWTNPRKINTHMNQDTNCYTWSDFSSFSVIFFYSQLFRQWEEWVAPQGKCTVFFLSFFLCFHFSQFIANLTWICFVALRSISEDFKVPDGMVGFSMYLFKNPKPQNAHWRCFCSLLKVMPFFPLPLVIGRGGEQISRLQQESGCKIQIAPGERFSAAPVYCFKTKNNLKCLYDLHCLFLLYCRQWRLAW